MLGVGPAGLRSTSPDTWPGTFCAGEGGPGRPREAQVRPGTAAAGRILGDRDTSVPRRRAQRLTTEAVSMGDGVPISTSGRKGVAALVRRGGWRLGESWSVPTLESCRDKDVPDPAAPCQEGTRKDHPPALSPSAENAPWEMVRNSQFSGDRLLTPASSVSRFTAAG